MKILIHPDNLVLAESILMLSQGLFKFFLPDRKAGGAHNLEGDKGRTSNPRWLKGYSLFLIIWCCAER